MLSQRGKVLITLLAILLLGGMLTTSLLTACLRRSTDEGPVFVGGGGPSPSSAPLAVQYFRDWPHDGAGIKKPDVAFVLTGQQHSYLKFCGCSSPQLGGFERRYNLMAKLKEMGWPIIAADLGDVVHYSGGLQDQSILKCEIVMAALETLGYSAMTLGEYDFSLPLDKGVAQFPGQKQDPFPRVLVANLEKKVEEFPNTFNPDRSWIGDWIVARPGKNKDEPKVGIAGIIGKGIMAKITANNPKIQFAPDNAAVLNRVLAEMAQAKVDLKLLLYQGSLLDAKQLAGNHFPGKFDLILCFSDEEQPPASADIIGKTMIVRVGHRGRFVGVVGAYRSNNPQKPYDFFYQSIALGEEFETDKGKEANHPILKLMDRYSQEVKSQEFLKRTPQVPVQIPPALAQAGIKDLKYIGSAQCVACHQADAQVWSGTRHSHAYDALVKVANKPAGRQSDPECIKCHVVGFGFQSGYKDHASTPQLKHVGCENCHGPGSAHAAQPRNPLFLAAMSPWKSKPDEMLPSAELLQQGFNHWNPQQKAIVQRVNDMCQKCHDQDNDPHFQFTKNWLQVMHGKGKVPVKPPAAQPPAVRRN